MLPDGMGYTVVATTNFATNATSGAFKILHSNDLISWNEVGMVFLQMFAGVACDFFHSISKQENIFNKTFFYSAAAIFSFPRFKASGLP